MSDIRLQSSIRKMHNEKFKTNPITGWSRHLETTDIIVDTKYIYQSKDSDNYRYSIEDITPVADNKVENIQKKSDMDLENYFKEGYYKNIFNAENCDIDWITFIFIINRVYKHFNNKTRTIITSLHFNNISILSAFNHFVYNSKITTQNIEWNWLCANDNLNNANKMVERKYKKNILKPTNNEIHHFNNINYVINETTHRLHKVNLIISNCGKYTTYIYIAYAIYALKLLDINGCMYMQIPSRDKWDMEFINILVLYTVIFKDIYIYNFDLTEEKCIMVCSCKKKSSNEILYKRLLYLLKIFANDSDMESNINIFSKNIYDNPIVKTWVDNILDTRKNIINSEDVINVINDLLDINLEPFL